MFTKRSGLGSLFGVFNAHSFWVRDSLAQNDSWGILRSATWGMVFVVTSKTIQKVSWCTVSSKRNKNFSIIQLEITRGLFRSTSPVHLAARFKRKCFGRHTALQHPDDERSSMNAIITKICFQKQKQLHWWCSRRDCRRRTFRLMQRTLKRLSLI